MVWDVTTVADSTASSSSDLTNRVLRQWRFPTKKGWVENAEGDLVLWMPPEYHKFLSHPSRRLVIPNVQPSVDVGDFVHGTEWTMCYKGLSSA